jgi:hypothetical protein
MSSTNTAATAPRHDIRASLKQSTAPFQPAGPGPAPRRSPREAAKKLRKSVHTVNRWRQQKRGPVYYSDGREIYYLDEDLEAFAAARIRRHEPRPTP